MLSMRLLHSATVLPSDSYYTVVASIFLISAASYKAICRVQGGDTPMLPLIPSATGHHESLTVYYWKSMVRVQ